MLHFQLVTLNNKFAAVRSGSGARTVIARVTNLLKLSGNLRQAHTNLLCLSMKFK